ncbi:MAG TPA: T9SS type A sorting domain-containing protein, partial [Flavobacteriales bacterium]|nr:T9SS type A sorting domain-containing protein [Flavobacteriales bacterium]
KEFEFNIYPNPTSGVVHFDFSEESNRDINVTIFDISGKVLVIDDVTRSARENYSVNLSEFSRGIYYIRVHDGRTVHTKKVSLIR